MIPTERLKIAVLALQGDFAEHLAAIKACGASGFQLRRSWELDNADALIIPGGESTALAKLTNDNDDPIFDTIRTRIQAGMPVYGTCMGSIFLAKDIEGSRQGRLGLMDIKVRRNAFGPQRNSFQMPLKIACLGANPFPAVFIRAPIILSAGREVEVLASLKEGIIMARQAHMLVSAFHPEIAGDLRVHQYFLNIVSTTLLATQPGFLPQVSTQRDNTLTSDC
jgi:pyridoxal 5'-phosphate synthase pdxT subunit